MMGGVRVDAETQMSTVPGLFAAGEVGAGLHGANRLGGNSLSDLLVFGKRAGEHAARHAHEAAPARIDPRDVAAAEREALRPFEAGGSAENPWAVQHELQATMQDLVGIVRKEDDMRQALDRIAGFQRRATAAGVPGHREFNPGWHAALDLPCMLVVSEAITRAALERRESRGAQFREDFPDKDPALGKVSIVVRKREGKMEVAREPLPALPGELAAIIEEMK
jgi:succinate dehydrogenase / fumarate reductase flavoprotein subunit